MSKYPVIPLVSICAVAVVLVGLARLVHRPAATPGTAGDGGLRTTDGRRPAGSSHRDHPPAGTEVQEWVATNVTQFEQSTFEDHATDGWRFRRGRFGGKLDRGTLERLVEFRGPSSRSSTALTRCVGLAVLPTKRNFVRLDRLLSARGIPFVARHIVAFGVATESRLDVGIPSERFHEAAQLVDSAVIDEILDAGEFDRQWTRRGLVPPASELAHGSSNPPR